MTKYTELEKKVISTFDSVFNYDNPESADGCHESDKDLNWINPKGIDAHYELKGS